MRRIAPLSALIGVAAALLSPQGAAAHPHLVDRTGDLQWHDHRMHWMRKSLPPQVTDKSKRTKVFD